ncbi:TIGR02678 family protein [Streptomyces johnsoniae]|uniref:TIGR02678 family protein n=1 Tax=Streptomyces johnsoniae TaxID=3075532 RepID=A0ABU2S4R0_9ACTN|nr:TIGR02678 family protein [Streptomyces sp. DSM 41886]MDT0443793.1 TIGR02678 family protein [Streptomyces sp. DSM 41886]
MSTGLDEANAARRQAERQRAARALLRRPLLRAHGAGAEEFRLVRQHGAELRAWFDRNTGWPLRIDAETARLRKLPGSHGNATHPAREASRGASPFTRRRYVLLCLALAALERGESQIVLGRLAEQVVLEAADPALSAAGISFTLEDKEEKADLVAVVRLLMDLGVLVRVAGDESAYLQAAGDALYDVERRVLAGLLATPRGPSTVAVRGFEERLAALAAEAALDSDELRNRRLRHTLTRRLLDDPVLYFDELTEAEAAYLTGQRGAITRRITELTGLIPEIRAEGMAMVDPDDELTDVRMPEQGTHGHITLLLAEYLAARRTATTDELKQRVRGLAAEHGGYWSKSAREPGAEGELVAQAVAKLRALRLVEQVPDGVTARPALARYAVGDAILRGHGRKNR